MKKILFILIIFLSLFFSCQKQIKLDKNSEKKLRQAETLFQKAMDLSQQESEKSSELFLQSGQYFENLALQEKLYNGAIFYNAANAYLRAEKLGKAILNYKRARLFLPNDRKIKSNLAYARSLCLDEFKIDEQQKISRILFFWHFDFPLQLRLWISLILISFVLVLCALLLLGKLSKKKLGLIVPALLLALPFSISLFIEGLAPKKQEAVIIEEQVIARKGNSESYSPAFESGLHQGTEFQIVLQRGEWLLARFTDGREAWLSSQSAEKVDPGF